MRFALLAVAALLLQDPAPAAPFLQLKEGAVWTYVTGDKEGKIKVTGRETINQVETFVLTTDMAGDTSVKEFIAIDAAGIRMLRQAAGANATDYSPPIVRLKLPPADKDTWEWKGEIGKEKASIVYTNQGEEEITVPGGKYKAWKISAEMEIGGVKHTGTNWFAAGIGLIRQQSEFESGGKKHKSLIELKSFEPGA
ncbi:MAG TPA: hypothetical protein VFS19_06840 [Planctomycetota bacterium]|nr:hypothetical protein [Planctomycetota bacterium]